MTEERNKWVDAIAKLIELTQQGKLEWKVIPLTSISDSRGNKTIEAIFRTTYKEKYLRLYRRQYTAYRFRQWVSPLARMFGTKEGDMEPYLESEIILEFTSNDGQVLWKYPDLDSLSDLLSTVQFQVAGVKDFLNDILSESDD